MRLEGNTEKERRLMTVFATKQGSEWRRKIDEGTEKEHK